MNLTPTDRERQTGFTLMELTVVVAMAGIVTLGLVAFYLQSQMLWMDASTQALAQRDATTIIEAMREKAETAASAEIQPAGGGNSVVVFKDPDDNELGRFFWSPADSLVHYALSSAPADDKGPLAPTRVERFALSAALNQPTFLKIDTLRVRSTTGQTVQMSSGMALYNAP
jgi:prepilin-type N-terminal cleavage/methylation domain-containing protein